MLQKIVLYFKWSTTNCETEPELCIRQSGGDLVNQDTPESVQAHAHTHTLKQQLETVTVMASTMPSITVHVQQQVI